MNNEKNIEKENITTGVQTKQELMEIVRSWVKLDNEIRALQKENNIRKQEKKKISIDLINVMKRHEIECFDITDGQINYVKKNVKKPISQKMLLSILSNYFNGDVIRATEMNSFILGQREEVTEEKISRSFA